MDALKSVLVLSVLLVEAVLFAGCSSQPVYGVVERQPALTKGTIVPDIPFTTADGKQVTLFTVRQPIAIMGFVRAPVGTCCQVDPELADLSVKFRRLPVSVVQVIVPQGTNRPDLNGISMPDLKRLDPIVLYDQDRVVWNGYGKPKTGTLVLINKDDAIIEVADMQNPKTLTRKATMLALDQMNAHAD
jgi:hypothetical protein